MLKRSSESPSVNTLLALWAAVSATATGFTSQALYRLTYSIRGRPQTLFQGWISTLTFSNLYIYLIYIYLIYIHKLNTNQRQGSKDDANTTSSMRSLSMKLTWFLFLFLFFIDYHELWKHNNQFHHNVIFARLIEMYINAENSIYICSLSQTSTFQSMWGTIFTCGYTFGALVGIYISTTMIDWCERIDSK